MRTKSSLCSNYGLGSLHVLLDIVVSKFELQSRYYVHFQTNVLGKSMNLLNLLLPAMG